jgi:hypothetical protein
MTLADLRWITQLERSALQRIVRLRLSVFGSIVKKLQQPLQNVAVILWRRLARRTRVLRADPFRVARNAVVYDC